MVKNEPLRTATIKSRTLPRSDKRLNLRPFFSLSRIEGLTGAFPSKQLQSPEVVNVEDAFEAAGGIHDEDRGDFLFFHPAQGAGGEFGARNGDGILGHAIGGD